MNLHLPLSLAFVLATSLVTTASAANTLYVGVYNQNQILRYDASGNPINPTPWIGTGSTASPTALKGEGIAVGTGFPTSVPNPIFIANLSAGTIEIADANALTSANPITNSAFISGLSNAANIALSNDGHSLYVAQETGNLISKYDAVTGTLLASASFTGAHDVVIGADNSVYVTAYGSSQPASQGIVKFNANLDVGSKTQFVALNNNGLDHATGMTFDANGNLWVANVKTPIGTTASTSNFVSEYDASGNYIRTVQSNGNRLLNVFGLSLGDDDNIYAASFSGHQITKIDTTTFGTSTFINLPNNYQPKYATWGSDSVAYSPVPEPRDYALILLGGAGFLMVVRSFRRFQAAA